MASFGGTPLRNVARNALLSGVAGAVSGLTYKALKDQPGKLIFFGKCAAIAGVTGTGVGYIYARFKRQSVVLYGFSSGLKISLITGGFFGIREALSANEAVILKTTDKKLSPLELSASSGIITGLLAGLFSSKSIIPVAFSTAIGGTLGVTGHVGFDIYSKWRLEKVVKRRYKALLKSQKLENCEEPETEMEDMGYLSWISAKGMQLYKFLQEPPYSSKLGEKVEKLKFELEVLKQEENLLRTNKTDQNDEEFNT